MKELYKDLELEVIRFRTEDIITTSAETTEQTTNVDDYTATGDTFTDMYGTTYPVYIKDGDPSQLYINNGTKMVALTMPKS